MPFPDDPGPLSIQRVAAALGALSSDVVFVGGAVIPLLATAPVLPNFRETVDVDFIAEIVSRASYSKFEEAMRQRGFTHDTREGAPLCRWQLGPITVDAMPTESDILGFSNPWYPHVLEASRPFTFDDGPTVRIASAPTFVATKWTAFQHRGRRGGEPDYYASHDLEDILTVLDSREETVAETEEADPEVRNALIWACRSLLEDARFVDALPGLVEKGRRAIVTERLRALASLHIGEVGGA